MAQASRRRNPGADATTDSTRGQYRYGLGHLSTTLEELNVRRLTYTRKDRHAERRTDHWADELMSRPATNGHRHKSLDAQLQSIIEAHLTQYRIDVEPEARPNGLSRIRIYEYIIARDRSMLRRKKVMLEKLIDQACRAAAQKELDNGMAQVTLIDSSEDEADVHSNDVGDTSDPPPLRTMNERITAEWAPAPESAKSAGVGADSSVPAAAVATAKSATASKRRAAVADDAIKPKRLKANGSSHISAPTVNLSSLGGMQECIEQVLETVVLPLTHPELYVHTGIQPPRGVLLHGPPGCGKTMLANAVAGEVGVPFLSLSAPTIVSGMSGESEKKLREVFDEAKSLAPCILFFDEIDAVTPKRESAQREMERRIVAQMLTCMDELSLDKTDGRVVIVLGATNRPDALDAALRRAGRFDREICLAVPDEDARHEILSVLSKTMRLDPDVDLRRLANATPGYVGADLKALMTAAGVATIKRISASLSQTAEPGESTDEDMSKENGSAPIAAPTPRTGFQALLHKSTRKFSEAELGAISVSSADFDVALRHVQPSSKREGFTTVPDVSWTDIGALQAIRAELQMAIVQPIRRPDLYKRVGITAPAGVLLWGPPGCGKTLLAKAVANESRANFISIRGPELLNKFVGESERAVRQVFSRARASAPCVIFFDELDALVPRRDDALSDSSARLVNTLLTELDGLGDRHGVFVIAATNRPDMIDPAMLRPGRLDKPLFVCLPVAAERSEILRTLAKQTPLDSRVRLDDIAADERCHNFSGADLSALLREAAVTALRRTVFDDTFHSTQEPAPDITVTVEDFNVALGSVKPSVSDQERRKYENLRRSYP